MYNTETGEIQGLQTEICKRCTTETYIVNRTHHLCQNCNYHRLHGISYQDHQRAKQIEYRKKQQERHRAKKQTQPTNTQSKTYNAATSEKKPAKAIKTISHKQKRFNIELKEVKHNVRETAFYNNEYYCKGCGKGTALDVSHNIALSQSKGKGVDYDNLVLLCRLCHCRYESNDPKLMNELLCLDEILEYLRINNPERYYKKMYKLQRI